MASSVTLKIDGCEHVVEYTASEDNVVVRSVKFHNVVIGTTQLSATLKFSLQNAVAEILNGDVKVENVDVRS